MKFSHEISSRINVFNQYQDFRFSTTIWNYYYTSIFWTIPFWWYLFAWTKVQSTLYDSHARFYAVSYNRPQKRHKYFKLLIFAFQTECISFCRVYKLLFDEYSMWTVLLVNQTISITISMIEFMKFIYRLFWIYSWLNRS